jgi:predicted nucleic acid-binding protein
VNVSNMSAEDAADELSFARHGRRAARAVGLTVTGTLGLLARAKLLGALAAMCPIVERMQARGVWFDEEHVRSVLAQLGE